MVTLFDMDSTMIGKVKDTTLVKEEAYAKELIATQEITLPKIFIKYYKRSKKPG